MGETDAAGIGPIQHGCDDGARLRDEGQVAALWRTTGEARVEADTGDDDAETVRPDDTQLPGFRCHRERLAALETQTFATFPESRRDDDRSPCPICSERADDIGHGVGGCANHPEID